MDCIFSKEDGTFCQWKILISRYFKSYESFMEPPLWRHTKRWTRFMVKNQFSKFISSQKEWQFSPKKIYKIIYKKGMQWKINSLDQMLPEQNSKKLTNSMICRLLFKGYCNSVMSFSPPGVHWKYSPRKWVKFDVKGGIYSNFQNVRTHRNIYKTL